MAIWLSLAWVLTSDSVVPARKTDAHGLSKEVAEIHSGIPQCDPIPILFQFCTGRSFDHLSCFAPPSCMRQVPAANRQLLPPSAPPFICAVHAVGGVVTAARRVGQRDRRVQRHHLADWACDITDYSVKNHGCLQGSFCKREFVFRWRCVAMQVCVSIDWLAMSERQVRHRFAFGQGQVCAEDLLQEVARLRWSGQQRVAAYRSHSTVTAGAAFATSAGLRSVVVLLMLFACFIWGGGGCWLADAACSSPRRAVPIALVVSPITALQAAAFSTMSILWF